MKALSNARPGQKRPVLAVSSALAGLALALTFVFAFILGAPAQSQQAPNTNVRPPAGAVVPGGPGVVEPGKSGNYDIELWKKVREGIKGQVSIPDKKAGQLVQSDGESWRNFRNGPLPKYGLWSMGGIVVLLAAFFLLRGRIPIEHGWAGHRCCASPPSSASVIGCWRARSSSWG